MGKSRALCWRQSPIQRRYRLGTLEAARFRYPPYRRQGHRACPRSQPLLCVALLVAGQGKDDVHVRQGSEPRRPLASEIPRRVQSQRHGRRCARIGGRKAGGMIVASTLFAAENGRGSKGASDDGVENDRPLFTVIVSGESCEIGVYFLVQKRLDRPRRLQEPANSGEWNKPRRCREMLARGGKQYKKNNRNFYAAAIVACAAPAVRAYRYRVRRVLLSRWLATASYC
jgi:hypothetical protein